MFRELLDTSSVTTKLPGKKIFSKKAVGTRWSCRVTGDIGIISERKDKHVMVVFNHSAIICTLGHLKRVGVISPIASFVPTIFGTGFLGIGPHKTSTKSDNSGRCNHSIKYMHFKEMHRRCAEGKKSDSSQYGHYHHWNNHTVNKAFCNFQIFGDWFDLEKSLGYYSEGWHLDKDLLGTRKGILEYSPETCCFLPPEINSALTKAKTIRGDFPIGVSRFGKDSFVARVGQERVGVFTDPISAFLAYKSAKEGKLKLLAYKYKTQLNPRAYLALYDYSVNIDD